MGSKFDADAHFMKQSQSHGLPDSKRCSRRQLGPVLSWAEGGLAFTVVEKAARIISESEGERIGITCGTPFDDAGAVRIGIHESLIV